MKQTRSGRSDRHPCAQQPVAVTGEPRLARATGAALQVVRGLLDAQRAPAHGVRGDRSRLHESRSARQSEAGPKVLLLWLQR